MAKKFILLQIVMVTFGIALFFALASLKQRVSDKIGPDDSGAAAIDQAENARGGAIFMTFPDSLLMSDRCAIFRKRR